MLDTPQQSRSSGGGPNAGVVVPAALLALCAALYFVSPMLAVAGAAGALIFLLAYRKPAHWLAVAFAAGILPQSLLGDSSSVFVAFSDVMAALMVVVLVFYVASGRLRPTLGPLRLPLLLFLAVALLASVANWRGSDAVLSLGRYVEFTLCTTLIFAAFIKTPTEMERCFLLLLVAESLLGLAAVVGFAAGAKNGLYILGMHKNSIGPSLACGVVIGLVYLRSSDIAARFRPWIIAAFVLSLMGTILSLSRGAWTAATVACLLVLALRRDLRGLAVMAALAVPIFAVCWIMLPSDSAEYAGNLSLHANTMQIRLDKQAAALNLWQAHPFLGTGVGLGKQNTTENVYVLTLAEMGAVGLAVFLFLLGSVYALLWRLCRSLPQRALRSSQTGRILLCCAGVFTVPTVHGAVDAYWRRGVVFLAWAAAGLCVSMFFYLKRQKATSVQPVKGIPTRAT